MAIKMSFEEHSDFDIRDPESIIEIKDYFKISLDDKALLSLIKGDYVETEITLSPHMLERLNEGKKVEILIEYESK